VATLSERGVKLEFSRMRLSLVHGFVAENVRAGELTATNRPAFAARSVQLQLNYPALLHRRWQLDGLVIRNGTFTLPLATTNALTLTNLQTELRFLPGDTWALDHFRADFAGAQIGVSGEVAHAPAALDWKFFGGPNTNRAGLTAALDSFSDSLRRLDFMGKPQLQLTLAGDAREVHSITVQLTVTAPGVDTPWFVARDFSAQAVLTAPAGAPTNTEAAWGFWTNLQPFRLGWSVRLGALRSEPLDADTLACAGVWNAATLAITNLTAQTGGGRATASAALDVGTREIIFTSDSQFDWQAIAKMLPEKTRTQLEKIFWTQPPALHANGRLLLPSWTNAVADSMPALSLRGELAFTNATVGKLKLDEVRSHFSYADQMLDVPDLTVVSDRTRLRLSGQTSAATGNFHYLLTGQLEESTVSALLPENAAHGLEVLTCREPLALSVDAAGNLHTLETVCVKGSLALTNFSIRSEAMDAVAGTFIYTNLAVTIFAPGLQRAGGTQWMRADTLWLDFRSQALWITNGLSLIDPQVVTRAIGPKTAHMIEPYHFFAPPLAQFNGSVPIVNVRSGRDLEYADLTIEILRGTPFRWARLDATNVTGIIHWQKQSLTLANIVAQLYDGSGTGEAFLDFRPVGHDCDFNFSFAVTNINLHLLAADLSTNKNDLEGRLGGTVVVTNASSDDWHSWNGFGNAHLRDGLLWNVPIFAIVSPLLNHVSPGLGNNRASDATAPFVITNGVITTDNLQIRTEMMRLQYTGTVDLMQNVNAHVTAQLLRNTPVIGSLVSTVLWPVSKIFECHVTGSLGDPVVTPVYIPKILLAPLHPIRSLEELFSSPATNAAAAGK
jgi:hypothetical protein